MSKKLSPKLFQQIYGVFYHLIKLRKYQYTDYGAFTIYINNFLLSVHAILERMVKSMSNKKFTNAYDDGNIPDIDLPQDNTNTQNDSGKTKEDVNSLSKSSYSAKEE